MFRAADRANMMQWEGELDLYQRTRFDEIGAGIGWMTQHIDRPARTCPVYLVTNLETATTSFGRVQIK